jgi:hypothetical protein
MDVDRPELSSGGEHPSAPPRHQQPLSPRDGPPPARYPPHPGTQIPPENPLLERARQQPLPRPQQPSQGELSEAEEEGGPWQVVGPRRRGRGSATAAAASAGTSGPAPPSVKPSAPRCRRRSASPSGGQHRKRTAPANDLPILPQLIPPAPPTRRPARSASQRATVATGLAAFHPTPA